MWHVLGRAELHKEFWWGNLRETDHLNDLSINGRIILIFMLRRMGEGHGLVFVWLKIGTGGGHF